MQENSETNPENTTGPQESEAEPPLPPSTDPEPEPPKQPEPKRRGRPEGAKDRAPRKKKVVTIVEEDAPKQNTPEPEAAAAPVQTPAPPVQAPEEPDTPRTLIRNAADHILKLKNVTKMARKAHLQDEYTKRLHSLS